MDTGRKKILWLVSWYPNANDRFDGDFIQRHARAAAIFHDVHVIFVTDRLQDEEVVEEWNHVTGLTEQLIYFKKQQGLLYKINKQLTWKKQYMRAVVNYFEKHGPPALVHVHIPWKAGLIALQLKREREIPFIVTEHWGIYNDYVEDRFLHKPFWVRRMIKNIFASAENILSVSRYLGNSINQQVVNKPFTVLPNVVDTSLFFYKETESPVFTFIHVSNMVPLKNCSGILKAFEKLIAKGIENIRLLMVGGNHHAYHEEAQMMGLLNKQVFFTGEISYLDVATHLQQSNCFVLNSHIENAPCVIAEALCCGLPVIATAVGGVPELVNESNGRLVPADDTEALALTMMKIYEDYADFNRSYIADQAHKTYSYSAISIQLDAVYQTF